MRAPGSPEAAAPLSRSPSTPSWLLLPRATPLRGRCRDRTTYESISALPRAAWPAGDGGGGWNGGAARRRALLALLLLATSASAALAGYATALFPALQPRLEARTPHKAQNAERVVEH